MRRGNGEGSILKLGGKRCRPYAVRVTIGFTPEGKQIYKYLSYHATKAEAKAALYQYLVNPYNLMNKDVTLFDVFAKWEESVDLAPATLKGYTSAFRQCPELYSINISGLDLSIFRYTFVHYARIIN